MQKQYQRKPEGFTIIETLIVLAIVGVIMIVVFLAVPALQRSSRNTQAKTDGTNIAGAVNEFVANNGGKMPTAGSSATSTTDAAKILANAKLQNITTVVVEGSAGSTAASATQAVVRTGVKCSAAVTSGFTGAVTTSTGAVSRQFVVIYPMEDSAGNATGCMEG